MKIHSNSNKHTIEIASKLAEKFVGGEIIILKGELGAGKTTFSKGIALGLGIMDTITSPTFTIMNSYSGRLTMYHYDMYRIAECDELYELGIESYIYSDGVSIIEWNKFDIVSDKIIEVNLEYVGENEREITII